ncbi:heavy metal-associated isoprenylated plant protein 2 [Sorghum bicolor]|uniref:HMA domain-containing protein n=1 Tax=Sorghum bicolor TaxID=4558 RepID=A0A1W0VVX6_SORBI|nr:heavy metal-associated isoprenylated plant protein 2 [Sorghum bicolor]OQU86264.1 hypothetical protein SORBI_3003G060200 [Sorghum bicolor]|eukprot:XP_002455152.2 heavy metal-associated isoprenylated plant protein 2 [Sorghum bicolor]
MSNKKIVVKADLVGKTCMRDILSVAATLQGIKSMDVDAEKCTLTVVGTVDPVRIAQKLKKKCFSVNIISVEDDKPKPKPPEPEKKKPQDPCKDVCENKCDKITCCKECKDECKETCERRCKAWLESGGCCTRCAVPSCYPYSYSYCYPYSGCSGGGSWPWRPYGC